MANQPNGGWGISHLQTETCHSKSCPFPQVAKVENFKYLSDHMNTAAIILIV